jgi:hypothetical protein
LNIKAGEEKSKRTKDPNFSKKTTTMKDNKKKFD